MNFGKENQFNYSRLVENDDQSDFIRGHITAKTMEFQSEKSFCDSVKKQIENHKELTEHEKHNAIVAVNVEEWESSAT